MSANDRQEGGSHYNEGENPQHWDLVQMYGWDYFQGQITKYLMRWKYKHSTLEKQLEDLKKARHFLDKYIEIAERGRPEIGTSTPNVTIEQATFEKFEKDSPRYTSDDQFLCEGGWGDGQNLYKCQMCRALVVSHGLAGAHEKHTLCPAPKGTFVGALEG